MQKNLRNNLQIVDLEGMVPYDHLVRKLDRVVDYTLVDELYCEDNGRPAVDPVYSAHVAWPKNQGEIRDISRRQLEWLLQGLQIDQKKAHPDSIDTAGMIF